MKARIHFNRQGAPKGWPWTVHTSKECIRAKEVRCKVPTSTAWKPEKKDNPRAFITAQGTIVRHRSGLVEIL